MKWTFLVIGTLLPLSNAFFSGIQSPYQSPPTLVGLFKKLNPFSLLVVDNQRQTTSPEQDVDSDCERLGGTTFEYQCVELIPMTQSFSDARVFCGRKGGDLWVPSTEQLNDPFFFQKTLLNFPKLFRASTPHFWIGISKGPNSGYVGVNGEDVSGTTFVRTNDDGWKSKRRCAAVTYAQGVFKFLEKDCGKEHFHYFVCEYPTRGSGRTETIDRRPERRPAHPFFTKFLKG